MKNNFFLSLIERWPSSVVARTEFPKFSGGLYTENYMANADCAGIGPEGRFRVGRKIVYPVDKAAAWLESRSTTIPKRLEKSDHDNAGQIVENRSHRYGHKSGQGALPIPLGRRPKNDFR